MPSYLHPSMLRGERLAVIGPSGLGKSTLRKTLVGEYPSDSGEVLWGHETSVGYFSQDHHEALEPGFTADDWLRRFDETATIAQVRSALGNLLFRGEAAQRFNGTDEEFLSAQGADHLPRRAGPGRP